MRKSSYQKLKEENLLLRQKIDKLIMFPDSQESIMIRMVHKSNRQIEEHLMSGSPIGGALSNGGNGVLQLINQQNQ